MTLTTSKAQASAAEARPGEANPSLVATDFEAIFLEHWPRVYGVLVRLVGDHAEAEDLALESFWRLYQRLPEQEQQLNIGGWLYRVATNLGLNAIRGGKRRERYEVEAGRWDVETRSATDPAEAAVEAEERRRVRQVLRRMNARQSQLLILRHSGLSYREIAEALNVAISSVGTLLARAEQEFERRYRDATGDE